MKRNVLVRMVGFLLVLFALGGLMLAAGGRGGGTPTLSTRLEALQFYTPTEPVNMKFNLYNPFSGSLWVLRWQVPSHDMDANLFEVTCDGRAVPYTGRLVKRAEPTADDYVEVRAGGFYEAEFDPTGVYDMSAQGNYSIRYRAEALDVRTVAPVKGMATPPQARIKLTDAYPVGLWFEGLPEGSADVVQPTVIGGYSGACTTSQKSTLSTAHSNAISIATKAKNHLAANPSGSTLYTYWFGTYTSSRFSTVKTHYNSVIDAFTNKSVVYDCSCKDNYYAYVYPTQPYKIYVCSAFWSAPALGTDSKAGTLVHEMTHFNVTCSTDDWVYGSTGAHNLAVSNPSKAIDNADNHEYFAEKQ